MWWSRFDSGSRCETITTLRRWCYLPNILIVKIVLHNSVFEIVIICEAIWEMFHNNFRLKGRLFSNVMPVSSLFIITHYIITTALSLLLNPLIFEMNLVMHYVLLTHFSDVFYMELSLLLKLACYQPSLWVSAYLTVKSLAWKPNGYNAKGSQCRSIPLQETVKSYYDVSGLRFWMLNVWHSYFLQIYKNFNR